MDQEEQEEREKAEQSILALREERSKILAERKQKIQEKATSLGGDKEEHQKLIKSHDENTQRLVNKIDAERLRMEADLHERLRKKREVKYKMKESEMREELLKKRKQMEESDRQKRQHLAKEEKEKLEELQKSLQCELTSGLQAEGAHCDNAGSILHDLPLTEQQLTLLLLSSPLYQKLDEIATLLQTQPFGAISNPSHYIDPKDAQWVSDTKFHAVDVNLISPKTFVIYKFGCCIINSLTASCNHDPVSLLIADKIPPNSHIKQNAFCNSFKYDAENRILYLRLERLEKVGEFILILVHILSHIHVGRFDSDSDPRFVREFYRCLSVCCSDLFLNRYQDASLVQYGINERDKSFQITTPTGMKSLLVDDLLDSRLMMDTDSKGGKFSHERLMHRLQRYAEFEFGSKLRVFLDQLEEERQSHDSEYDDKNHSYSSAESNKEVGTTREATRPLNKISRWRAIAKRAVHKSSMHTGQYRQFLEMQTRDLQERIGKLNIEYAQVAKERSEVNAEVEKLERLLSAHQDKLKVVREEEFESQKQSVKNTAVKLSAARTEQATYDLRVNGCLKRLEGFKTQFAQKLKMLEEYGI